VSLEREVGKTLLGGFTKEGLVFADSEGSVFFLPTKHPPFVGHLSLYKNKELIKRANFL